MRPALSNIYRGCYSLRLVVNTSLQASDYKGQVSVLPSRVRHKTVVGTFDEGHCQMDELLESHTDSRPANEKCPQSLDSGSLCEVDE